MAGSPSRFVWYELMTPDPAAAQAFYAAVVGWGAQDASQPGKPYRLLTVGGAPIGGLMGLPRPGAPPCWTGYVGVADAAAAAARAESLGGAVHAPPADIPGVGRFAVIADQQGAAVVLFRGRDGDAPPPDSTDPGFVGWRELATDDWPAAFAFYEAMFGWRKVEAVDMGAMGVYQLFAGDGAPIGGRFNRPPGAPGPCWLYYFVVDDIDAAAARLKAAGGKVLNGPMSAPGGAWIVQAQDPQGVFFALTGPRKG